MPSSACKKCALRSEEHTSELQSHDNLVCRLLLENTRRRHNGRLHNGPPTPGTPCRRPPGAARSPLPAASGFAGWCAGRAFWFFFFFLKVRAPPRHPPPPPPPPSVP